MTKCIVKSKSFSISIYRLKRNKGKQNKYCEDNHYCNVAYWLSLLRCKFPQQYVFSGIDNIIHNPPPIDQLWISSNTVFTSCRVRLCPNCGWFNSEHGTKGFVQWQLFDTEHEDYFCNLMHQGSSEFCWKLNDPNGASLWLPVCHKGSVYSETIKACFCFAG